MKDISVYRSVCMIADYVDACENCEHHPMNYYHSFPLSFRAYITSIIVFVSAGNCNLQS